MKNKVLVSLSIPEIDKKYDVYLGFTGCKNIDKFIGQFLRCTADFFAQRQQPAKLSLRRIG